MLSNKKKSELRKLRRGSNIPSVLSGIAIAAAIFVTIEGWNEKVSKASTVISTAPRNDIIQVPVPLRTISQGQKLSTASFTLAEFPNTKVSEGYIQNIEEYRGYFALASLPAHTPIARYAITKEGTPAGGLVERIPSGYRAITISVDEVSAVEGWARSGSYVDVIALRAAEKVGLEAKVIAENVKILSAGRSVKPIDHASVAPKAPGTVTLLCTQEDALKIKTAARVSQLTFSLRGLSDGASTHSTSMSQGAVFGDQSPQAEPTYQGYATAPNGKTYRLRHGEWVLVSD